MNTLGLTPPSGGGGVGSIRVTELTDFTGGLNLSADRFKVQLNESPDMLNVDVHARGGVELRGGITSLTEVDLTVSVGDLMGVWEHVSPGADELLTVSTGLGVVRSVDGATGDAIDSTPGFVNTNTAEPDELFGTQMNDWTYVTSRRWGPRKQNWDGATMTWTGLTAGATASWDEDVAGLGTGVFPHARCSTLWNNRMWVASTIEDGTQYRNRVRFSVDGNPEQWRADDWIDIDVGEDGDQITALATHGEFLLVFKSKAMYAVYPSETLTYGVAAVASNVGAANPYAVMPSQFGLWFWDPRVGLHVWNSGSPTFAGQKLLQAIQTGRVPVDTEVFLGWINSRLWVATSLDGEDVNFVFDPQTASWTVYAPAVSAPRRLGDESVGYSPGLRQWLKVDQRTAVDNFGAEDQPISAHWTSAHIHGGAYYRKKRFRSPRVVMSADSDARIPVTVSRDQDPGNVVRQFFLDLAVRSEGLVWGVDNWGEDTWVSDGAAASSQLLRGKPLCTAYSVQFRFDGPLEPVRWRLDSFAAPYISKALR